MARDARSRTLPHDRNATHGSSHHRRRPCRHRSRLADRAARRSGRAARDAPGRARPRPTRPPRSPSSSARTRSAPTTMSTTPSVCCMPRCAGSARWSCGPRTTTRSRPAARLAVDRDGFAAAVTAALTAHPLIEVRREEVAGLPPTDWDSVIIATGPLTSPALAEALAAATGERRARLLRCHRADRASRQHRHVDRLAAVALRQGRPRRLRRRLHQLPAHPRAVRVPSSMPCSPAIRFRFTSSKPRPPISTAACRSRSWQSVGARRCATVR